jgi:glutamine synthetase
MSFPTLEQLPEWGFDGSSTQQAEGGDSDCVLKPVAIYADGTRENGALVMCEVMLPDGSPHPSNSRATILDDENAWFGFEQEYFFEKDGNILGFPKGGYPEPQGGYYCGVGYKNVGDIGRAIADEHLDLCLYAGINHEGINAEVAMGQWEFQVFGRGSKRAADQIWVARFLLERLGEEYGVDIEYHCKPLQGDWNGSGMHCNFSTEKVAGRRLVRNTLTNSWPLSRRIAWNTSRSTGPITTSDSPGLHETQSIDKFSWGIADRGASVRVPHSFAKNDWKGYLEDRRPNSQGDPYAIASRVLKTIAEADEA